MDKRNVKIGRTILVPFVAQHWAVKVGDTWHEVYDPQVNKVTIGNKAGTMKTRKSEGYSAESGAGKFGGNIVGKTTKLDTEIKEWIKQFKRKYPIYRLTSKNCQKFVLNMVIWLTDNNYKIDFMPEAARYTVYKPDTSAYLYPKYVSPLQVCDGFAASEEGNTIAVWTLGQASHSMGIVNEKLVIGQIAVQAVRGPGLGAFVDATLVDYNYTFGNYLGLHAGLNAKTGLGVRDGNFEAHVLGLGGKIGADGIEVNTPIFGVKACSIM